MAVHTSCVRALILLFGGVGTALAQAPTLVTDRPDFTESAEVVPLGLVQVEGGYTFARDDGASAHAVGELLVRWPILARVEARFGLNSLLVEDATGGSRTRYEGLGLGFKVKLFEARAGPGGWQPTLAVLGGTRIPLDGADDQEIEVSGRIAAAWEITSRFGLGANVGIVSSGDATGRFGQALTSLSAGFAATETTGLFLEYFGLHPESDGGSGRAFLNTGVAQRLAAGVQLDARVGAALSGPGAVFAGVGVAVRW